MSDKGLEDVCFFFVFFLGTYENYALFAHGGPVDSLPPPVKLRHDDVLCVVHVRPRREVHYVVDVLLCGQPGSENKGVENSRVWNIKEAKA